MGIFSKVTKPFKKLNPFKSDNLKSILMYGGTDKIPGMKDLYKGVGNLLTGGYIAQQEATEEAKQARDQAAKRYRAETLAAEETARKIAETEEERKRRLAMAGSQMPSTMTAGYLGFGGGKSLLG